MKKSVLFACNMNSVRSPMAAALLRLDAGNQIRVDSAGVYEGGLDPFVEIVMAQLGVAMQGHEPKTLSEVDLSSFDVVVALTPEAASEGGHRILGYRKPVRGTGRPGRYRRRLCQGPGRYTKKARPALPGPIQKTLIFGPYAIIFPPQ